MDMTMERRLEAMEQSRQARKMEGRLEYIEPGRQARRGQMYSIITILIIIPLAIFITYYVTASQSMKFGTSDRVIADQQHQVEKVIEKDFERAVRITTRRALLAAVNNVIINGSYLDDAGLRLQELILNSSIYSSPSILMANNTLYEWRSRTLSQDHSFNIDINFSGLAIENYDGINLKVSLLLTVNVSDSLNRSRIDKAGWMDVLVSVDGIEDPVFPLSTQGYVKKVVKEYKYEYYTRRVQGTMNSGNCSGNASFDSGDPQAASRILIVHNTTGISDPVLQGFAGVVAEENENLAARGVSCFVSGAAGALQNISANQTVYIDNLTASAWLLPINQGAEGTYYYRGIGPNFLQRLEGDLSESPDGKGLESFVPEEIGVPDKPGQTRMDYLFFSSQSHPGCRKARWTEDWLRLRAEEIDRYNLTDLSYPVC